LAITNQNVKLWRGDSKAIHVTLTDANGDPYDPSQPNIEIEWRLMSSPYGETLVQKLLSEGGIEEVSGGGEIVINLTPTDTDHFPRMYYHECKVFDNNAPVDVATVMTGVFVIYPSTRMGPIEGPAAAQLTLETFAPVVA